MIAAAPTLERLLARADLSREDARDALEAIMSGAWTPAQIAGFLVALRVKGETADEVAGLVDAMRARVVAVELAGLSHAIDTCGTGGDGAGTFNISTAAALVAAGAGARVAKHGNRAVSSRCGSADVLEALGVRIEGPSPARVARMVEEAGFGFLFAPAHHAALRQAAPVRRELGVRTVLNLLGPLANPAGVRRQVVGVYARDRVELVAHALDRLGTEEALVVHGSDGLDEITTTAETHVARLSGGHVTFDRIIPEDLGIARVAADALRGGDCEANARIVMLVLRGEQGPARDIVVVNAAAALVTSGVCGAMREGVERARESIDSGRAVAALDLVRRMSAE